MSLWGSGVTANSSSTYVSKLELTLSRQGTVRSPPPAFESAARDTSLGMVASARSLEGRSPLPDECCLREGKLGNSASHLGGAFPMSHRSRIDTNLAHANKGRTGLKDGPSMHPSPATPFQVPWRYPSSCWDPQGDETCLDHHNCTSNLGSAGQATPWSTNHSGTSHSAMKGEDAAKRNIFVPSAAPPKEQPCWTSRLDVVLDTSRASSPRPVNRFHTAFTNCAPSSSQPVCSRCMAQMSSLQNSVKWHMSTCSMAVKPFEADPEGSNHAHSVFLVPKRWKMPNSSQNFPGSVQAATGPDTPSLQITRFQVTSSTEHPPPAHLTSTKEIWLAPAMLNRGAGSRGTANVVSAEPDPNVFIFHNHHPGGAGIRNSPCPGVIPAHHKVSEVSLFLATPLASMPFQVIRECRRGPNPTILIQTHNPITNGPSLQTGDGPTVSLTINPGCCPEGPVGQQHIGSRPSWGAHPAGGRDPGLPYRNVQMPATNPPHVIVSIAALESGRRVVKISVSSSRNPRDWGNTVNDGYRNITLGN